MLNSLGITTPQALLVAGGVFLSLLYPSFVKGDKKNKGLISNIGMVSLAGGLLWIGYNYFNKKKSSNFTYALATSGVPVTRGYAPPVNDLSAIKYNFNPQTKYLGPLDNYLKNFTNGMPYPGPTPKKVNPTNIPTLFLSSEAPGQGSNTVRLG